MKLDSSVLNLNASNSKTLSTMKITKLVLSFTLMGLLAACSNKMMLPAAGQKVALKPTEQFLPKQAYDEKSQPVVYEEAENPYLAKRSRVEKGSVLLFIEAKKALRAENYSLAKQKLQVITRNDEDLSGPWVLLAEIAQHEKQLEKSEGYYQTALSINEENINAYVGLAKTQRLMGEFNVAQNTLALALALWPDFPEAHLNLGVLYDVYFNKSELAQKHTEAYLFLTGYKDMQAIEWLNEIKQRTGINKSFMDETLNVSDIIAHAMEESL